MQKRSVLFINDSLWNGSGVFRAMLPVLQCLPEDLFDITLYVSAGAATEDEAKALLPKNVRLITGEDAGHPYRSPSVFLPHMLSVLCGALKLKKTAARLRAKTREAVRAHRYSRQAKAYFGNTRFHVIVANTVPVCSEIAAFINAEKKYVLFHSSKPDFFPAQTKRCLETFHGVIAVGEGVKQMLKETYPQALDKILMIPNYVNAAEIRQKAKAFTLPADGRIRLCTCGRLEKEKGFDLAVGAARLLRDRGYSFLWYFVGDGTESDAIRTMTGKYGLAHSIATVGFQPNPYPYVAGCDIYVQPSYEEAQPLAVLEAQILEKAIVSTDTVGGRTILENGAKGVLTPISAEGLADGIEELIRDPARRAALQSTYSPTEDARNRSIYATAWNRLLSE